MLKWWVGGSSVALRALANRNRQSSRQWPNCSIHHRVSAVCRETILKQAVAAILRWKATWQSAFLCQKYTLPAFICCRRRFWKAFYGPNGPILAAFGRIMAPKTPENCWTTPPKKNQPKMRQNHPKMGFGGILDRLEAISILSISKYQRNKK